MIDRDEELIGRMLRRFLRQRDENSRLVSCPDEESLAGYLDGSLGNETEEAIEAHLAACPACADELVAAQMAAQETGVGNVPQRLNDRAMGLVPAKDSTETVLDLVVRLVKDSVKLVGTSGQWLAPLETAPVSVRGKGQPSESSILRVEKEIGKFKVAVEVERVEADLCQVVVNIAAVEGMPAEGVRVSLLAGARVRASYVISHGEAVFDRLHQGEYNLPLSEAGVPIGMIRLKME